MTLRVSPAPSPRLAAALVVLSALFSSVCSEPSAVETESASTDALVSAKPISKIGTLGYSAALTAPG